MTCCYITLQKPSPLTESGPLTYIDKPEQLECLLDDLLDVTEIAVDLEVFVTEAVQVLSLDSALMIGTWVVFEIAQEISRSVWGISLY